MILAGTSRGVFVIDEDGARSVLDCRGVRDVVHIDGRIFAATSAGLFVSRDGGDSWSLSGMADYEIWQLRQASDGTLYAGTQPAALFKSTDIGESWSEIESFANCPEAKTWGIPLDPPLPGRARAIVVDRDDPNRIWVGVEVGGIMHTSDGGETWTFDRPGDNPDLHMMYAHPDRPTTLFASTGYGREDHIAEEVEGNAGVYRSDDHGQTWDYAWAGIVPRYSRPMCIDERAPYCLTVASAPNAFSNHRDEDGAQAMLFRSDDHGDNWHSLGDEAHSPSAANFHGLMVDPDAPGGVVVGTDTGEVWRVSADAAWTRLASGLPAVLSLA